MSKTMSKVNAYYILTILVIACGSIPKGTSTSICIPIPIPSEPMGTMRY